MTVAGPTGRTRPAPSLRGASQRGRPRHTRARTARAPSNPSRSVASESLQSGLEVRRVLTGVHEARNPISHALVIRRVGQTEPLRACRGEHADTRIARLHLRANCLAQQELSFWLRAVRLEEPGELPLQRG